MPGLNLDAMLKMTKIELELFLDPDMYIIFEKGIRGRISYICNRYSKANKKYLKSCDAEQESKRIYLDTNNLSDYVVSKSLPTVGFKWANPEEFDLNEFASSSSKECVLEVDLEYPKELLELHNDCPLALNKIEIKREMLSEY